jgi:hypothetical protein
LRAGVSAAAAVGGAIDALVERKAQPTETDAVARIPQLDRLLAAIRDAPAIRPEPIDRPQVRAEIDKVFRALWSR